MSFEEIQDASGSAFHVLNYNGYRLPVMAQTPAEHLPAIAEWKTRPDDVFVCSYPKSGTNLVWEILSMLRLGQTEILSAVFPNIEITKMADLEALPSPRTLQTHMTCAYMPKHFLQNRGKIIYVTRNPKDVAVSMHSFMLKLRGSTYEGSWEDFLQLFYEGKLGYGSWYDHVRSWESFRKDNSKYPILFVSFEDLLRDKKSEIKKIAKFLQVPADEVLISKIAESVSFNNFKKEKLQKVGFIYRSISRDGNDVFFRKGIVGDWRNHFTVAQSDEFDRVYPQKMKGSKLKFCFQADKPSQDIRQKLLCTSKSCGTT